MQTTSPASQVVPYDFSHPPLLRPAEVALLFAAAGHLARSLGTLVSEYLRAPLHVARGEVGESRPALRGTEAQWVWLVAGGVDAEQCPIWRLDCPLAMELVNLMLGVSGTGRAPERPLTRLEGRLLARLGEDFFAAWLAVWPVQCPTPDVWRCVPGGEDLAGPSPDQWMAVSLQVSGPAASGELAMYLPLALARLPAPDRNRDRASSPTILAGSAGVRATPLTATVPLGTWQTTLRELLALEPGEVVHLGVRPQTDLRLCVGGAPKMTVRPGTHNGYLAVQVIGPCNQEE